MKTYYSLSILALLLLFTGIFAEEKENTWFAVESKGGNYKMEFPEYPIESHIPKVGGGIDAEAFIHEYSSIPYAVAFACKCFVYDDSKTPKERLDNVLEAFKVNYKEGTFKFVDSVSNKNFENKGVEYSGIMLTYSALKKKDIRGYLRVYYTKDRIYLFEVLGDDFIFESNFPDRFFNSFELQK